MDSSVEDFVNFELWYSKCFFGKLSWENKIVVDYPTLEKGQKIASKITSFESASPENKTKKAISWVDQVHLEAPPLDQKNETVG